MSPARTGADDRSLLGDTIVEELRASRLPFQPHQFEFWFAYKSGRNATLNAAADAIKLRNGALTGPDITSLHETHLSPWRLAGKPDAAATRLTGRLDDIATSIEGAISSAQAHRNTIAAEANVLGSSDALTLQDLLGAIDRLTQATRESQSRFGQFEARMDAANHEISTLRQQLAAVRDECRTCPTTALPSRTTFDSTLAKMLESAAESRQPISVMLCDLDYFAAFNESFGNYTGDRVLRSIAMLLKAQVRASDVVARFGGDEFAVILPHTRASDVAPTAEKFRQMLMAHALVRHPNGNGRLTTSIGIADAIKGRHGGIPAATCRERPEGRQTRRPQPGGRDDARRAVLEGRAARLVGQRRIIVADLRERAAAGLVKLRTRLSPPVQQLPRSSHDRHCCSQPRRRSSPPRRGRPCGPR